jgi:hypothetical protein
MNWLQILVPLISGGLAGAAVNAFITNRKQKLDVTLSVIKDFFALYESIGMIKGFAAAQDMDSLLNKQENMLLIRKVGDWFHYVAR